MKPALMKSASALAVILLLPLASHVAIDAHWPGAWLFYLPPIVIDLALCGVFASTLRHGREPLISRFARAEQGTLTPELTRYTRNLTRIWSGLFMLMALFAAGLARWGSFAAWSVFTGGISYALIGALFLGEYGYRRWRFPHYRHAPPWTLLRTIRRTGWRRPPPAA
jgi:Predicted membrane protein